MTNVPATVLLPAAGLGRRMKSNVRKPLLELGGDPILLHSLRVFDGLDFVSEILPIVPADDRSRVEAMLAQASPDKVRRLAVGGPERQDSVYNGLSLLDDHVGIVLVHDAVRPLVPRAVVEAVYHAVLAGSSAVPAVPLKDTIKEVGEGGRILSTPERSRFAAVQTPQGFPRSVLARAFEAARRDGFYGTDEAALVERIGEPVVVVAGSYENLKITTPEDLSTARAILENRRLAGSAP